MKGFDLELELTEDCVLSETSATVGGHRGLDYIPGANLLGAAASRLYGSLSSEDCFTAFHSGKVRFGNALPVTVTGQTSWPMPLCWHHRKRGNYRKKTGDSEYALLADDIWHLGLAGTLPEGVQPKQLRGGYVAIDGASPRRRKAYEMKTAIDPKTGRALDQALFGYEAMQAGTRLRASVTASDGVPDALLERLQAAFDWGIRVGRSRSAQFGKVKTSVAPLRPIDHGAANGTTVTLWLLSDLAAVDANGAPTLAPSASDLGLGTASLDSKKSFVRTRRYSPWNGYRRAHDLERFVISQGSVLHYELDAPPAGALSDFAHLGLYQEAGLGAVWINPPMLSAPQPRFSAPVSSVGVSGSDDQRPDSLLIDFLEWREAADRRSDDLEQQVAGLVRRYSDLRRKARQLRGLDSRAFTGPSISQWGNVIATARNQSVDLASALFDEDKGLCRPSMEGWQDEFWDADADGGGARVSFSAWLKAAIGDGKDHDLVALLAREIMSSIRKEEAA